MNRKFINEHLVYTIDCLEERVDILRSKLGEAFSSYGISCHRYGADRDDSIRNKKVIIDLENRINGLQSAIFQIQSLSEENQ